MSNKYMDQSRRDDELTATLPAWAWRLVVYAVECHVDERCSSGVYNVADNYQYIRDMLASSLNVETSGDLPHLDFDVRDMTSAQSGSGGPIREGKNG